MCGASLQYRRINGTQGGELLTLRQDNRLSLRDLNRESPYALLIVTLAPVVAVLVSVVFNVGYGTIYIEPLLTPQQDARLQQAILLFNSFAFPPVALLWAWLVYSLRPVLRLLRNGSDVDPARLQQARVRAINLPWHFSALIAVANLLCLPVFYFAVQALGEPLHRDFGFHLAVAIVIAAMITITIAFFLVELLIQRLLFPCLFLNAPAVDTPGAITLSLGSRGLLMFLAAGIGPISMLLLLGWVDDAQRGDINLFRLAVGALGGVFGLACAWLLGRLVLPPLQALRQAARAVAAGELDTEIKLNRADEFGTLIDEFNRMVQELRDKQRLRETFGLHVGEAAAEQILARNPGLGGQLREISVLFCDIRGFTALSAGRAPQDVVNRLNLFLAKMVDIVELHHGGMINKYLGDGFMALFGAGAMHPDHAQAAVSAAREILAADIEFKIGIGIHSGPAIVGNMGSARRLEYTAIGETVNLAARLEALTKTLSVPLVFSAATRARLTQDLTLRPLGAQSIRGQPQPVEVFTLDVC